MKSSHWYVLIAAIGLVLNAAAPQVSAALIAYEGFNYTAGNDVTGLNGGTGWGGNWRVESGSSDASLRISSPGMTYQSLVTSGNHLSNNGDVAFRTLSTTAAAAVASQSSSNGEVWISFLAKNTDAPYGGFTLWNVGAPENDSTDNYSLVLGRNTYDGGNWSWSDIVAAGNGGLSGIPTTTQVLYVMSLDYKAANTAVTMYLFSTGSPTSLSNANSTSSTIDTLDSDGRPVFDRIRMSGNVMNFDELRIGTSFADVVPVPEPAGLGLMALGLAFLWRVGGTHRRSSPSCPG